MKPINVAICGAGIGAEHLQAYLALPELYRVRYVADPDADRAKPLVELANCEYVSSFNETLTLHDVDLVDICLPPQMHKEAILSALDANKNVVCEKPLVPSLADIDEIIQAAERSSCQVMPVFQYRFGNGLSVLTELIDRGITGAPLVGTIETHWNRDADYYAVPWRGKWSTELGGAIVGHAIHAHDLLIRIFGPVENVQAQLATRVNDIEVEDCAGIVFKMKSGALITSSVTLGSATDQSRLRLCFSGLTAESSVSPYNPGTSPWTFTARNETKQSLIDEVVLNHETHKEGFARQFELAHQFFNQKGIAPVTLNDARASLEIISGIYQSSRQSMAVSLPLDKNSPEYEGWVPAT